MSKYILLASLISFALLPPEPDRSLPGETNYSSVANALVGRLGKSGHSALVVGRGLCHDGQPMFEFAPHPNALENNETDIQAIRRYVGGSPHFVVTEGPSHIILMIDPRVSRELLDVKIHHIKLGDAGRYYPGTVIQDALSSPELSRAARKGNFQEVVHFSDMQLAPPDPKSPHLPGDLVDVTLEEVMIDLLKIFPGVAIYAECAEPSGKIRTDTTFFSE